MFDKVKEVFFDVSFLGLDSSTQVWIADALLVLCILGFLHVQRKLNHLTAPKDCMVSMTDWVRPSAQALRNVSLMTKFRASVVKEKSIPNGALLEIAPWSDIKLAMLYAFVEQPAALEEIRTKKRIVTVSAIIYGFAIPRSVYLIDEFTLAIYHAYRASVAPERVLCEPLESAYLNSMGALVDLSEAERKKYEDRVLYLLSVIFSVAAQLNRYSESASWPMFEHFAKPITTMHAVSVEEVRSMVTAYAAATKLYAPRQYICNDSLAGRLHNNLIRDVVLV